MSKIFCEVCGEYVDKVVLSYGTRTWDEEKQAYVHRDDDDEGDWACAGCGTVVAETRFYPPSGEPTPFVEEMRSRQARDRAEEFLERVSQPLDIEQKRPFPKTYSDWVDLAEDIKAKYPDDPVMRATANYSLSQILAEEQRSEGWSAGAATEAKRWLVEKAGELGIK